MKSRLDDAVALASDKTAGFDEIRQAVLILGMELGRLQKLNQIEQDRLDWEMSDHYSSLHEFPFKRTEAV
jgi:hypothetical protein